MPRALKQPARGHFAESTRTSRRVPLNRPRSTRPADMRWLHRRASAFSRRARGGRACQCRQSRRCRFSGANRHDSADIFMRRPTFLVKSAIAARLPRHLSAADGRQSKRSGFLHYSPWRYHLEGRRDFVAPSMMLYDVAGRLAPGLALRGENVSCRHKPRWAGICRQRAFHDYFD